MTKPDDTASGIVVRTAILETQLALSLQEHKLIFEKLDKLGDKMDKTATAVAKSDTYSKVLWPVITILCTFIGFLFGLHF